MITKSIKKRNVQVENFVEHIRLMPSTAIKKKKSFEEACKECNAITVDEFFDELDQRIKKRFNA